VTCSLHKISKEKIATKDVDKMSCGYISVHKIPWLQKCTLFPLPGYIFGDICTPWTQFLAEFAWMYTNACHACMHTSISNGSCLSSRYHFEITSMMWHHSCFCQTVFVRDDDSLQCTTHTWYQQYWKCIYGILPSTVLWYKEVTLKSIRKGCFGHHHHGEI